MLDTIPSSALLSISQQTKHLRDITAIVSGMKKELDFAYIEGWVERKGLGSLWKELLGKIDTANSKSTVKAGGNHPELPFLHIR